jgi:hypothetical protein
MNHENNELRIDYFKKDGQIIIQSVNNILAEYLYPDYYKSIRKIIEEKYECKKA